MEETSAQRISEKNDLGLQEQKELLKRAVEEGRFSEKMVSENDTSDKKCFEMLEQAKRGEIGALYIRDVRRLAETYKESKKLADELSKEGVQIYVCDEETDRTVQYIDGN